MVQTADRAAAVDVRGDVEVVRVELMAPMVFNSKVAFKDTGLAKARAVIMFNYELSDIIF